MLREASSGFWVGAGAEAAWAGGQLCLGGLALGHRDSGELRAFEWDTEDLSWGWVLVLLFTSCPILRNTLQFSVCLFVCFLPANIAIIWVLIFHVFHIYYFFFPTICTVGVIHILQMTWDLVQAEWLAKVTPLVSGDLWLETVSNSRDCATFRSENVDGSRRPFKM